MNYRVIDNFAPEEYFTELYDSVMDNSFPWSFQEKVATEEDDPNGEQFYFIHETYHQLTEKSLFHHRLIPMFENIEMKALIRCRVIMYMNQGKRIIHAPHVDTGYSHKSGLLYLNTCNGYTRLANNDWKPEDGQGEEVFSEGNKVMSVRNRLLLHDGSIPHCSTTCTDQRMRILIAFNYF